MRLTLLVPELVWPEPADKQTLDRLTCPGLEWLLARGTLERGTPLNFEAALAQRFGLTTDAPFGPLRLLGETVTAFGPDARRGTWLCADPVHLRFHHERIVLADAGAFELTDDEAHALAIALNREFAEMGEFHVAASRRWYLRLHQEEMHAAAPLSAVAGRRMDGELPADGGASPLRRWLNEVQMFLHGHPVNEARLAAGQPPVNSLWLWGAGSLPETLAPPFTSVWSAAPLALGLARAARLPARDLPADLAALQASGDAGGAPLVVLDGLQAPVLYEDGEAWRTTLAALDHDWFAPARAGLGRGVDTLTLVAPTIYGLLAWEIRAADRWKVWRRPRPLAELATELAA